MKSVRSFPSSLRHTLLTYAYFLARVSSSAHNFHAAKNKHGAGFSDGPVGGWLLFTARCTAAAGEATPVLRSGGGLRSHRDRAV